MSGTGSSVGERRAARGGTTRPDEHSPMLPEEPDIMDRVKMPDRPWPSVPHQAPL